MRRKTVLLVVFLLLSIMISPSYLFFGSQNVGADDMEMTYPNSVTVHLGTSSGNENQLAAEDGDYLSVTESDYNTGRDYVNTSLDPNSAGTKTDWPGVYCESPHSSCSNNFEGVDEGGPSPGDSDTSYIFDDSLASSLGDTYAHDTYSFPSGHDTIVDVDVFGTSKIVTGGQGASGYRVCLYDTAYDCGSYNYPPTTYTEYSNTWTEKLGGGSWTVSDVNSVELGHRVNNTIQSNITSTLNYMVVQSTGPLYDYTLQADMFFGGIDYRRVPRLQITGYRSGDSENIELQISRAGSWTTLTSNAFTSSLTTITYPLSTSDLLGNVAEVRVVDADSTDNTQSTVHIDRIVILTEPEPTGPGSPIRVYVKLEYELWRNRLRLTMRWEQVGGSERAYCISRYFYVYIDGKLLRNEPITMPEGRNSTYLEVTWSGWDGGMHNASAIGFALINWTTGSVNYASQPDEITMDNFKRFLLIVIVFIIVLILVSATAVHAYNRRTEWENE